MRMIFLIAWTASCIVITCIGLSQDWDEIRHESIYTPESMPFERLGTTNFVTDGIDTMEIVQSVKITYHYRILKKEEKRKLK